SGGMFVRHVETQGNNGNEVRENVMMFRVAVNHNGKDAPQLNRVNPREAATWLLDNINVEPSANEVAQMVIVVEQAPLAMILKEHPEADTNGDGKLSAEEHEAFMAKEHEHMSAMLLKHFPEADTNGDGVLSDEEIRAIKGHRVIVQKQADGN